MAEIKCPCGLRDYMEEEVCQKTNCNVCCPLTNPHTNADRIRAMSDDELADFITSQNRGICTDICREMYYKSNLEWLKQPAE